MAKQAVDYLAQMADIDVPMPDKYDELVLEMVEDVDLDEKGFHANLAYHIPDDILGMIASEEIDHFEEDWDYEEGWRQQLAEGIKLLGTTFEERSEPFKGACGATHPLLAEAGVQFQSVAYKVLCPSGGPAKAKIVGKKTREIEDQARRVKDYLNHLLLDVMEEWEDDTDGLLFWLPFSGSMFRKIYYNRHLQRPMMKMVNPECMVLSQDTTDLASSTAYTHIIYKTRDMFLRDVDSGLYKPVHLTDGTAGDKLDRPVEHEVDSAYGNRHRDASSEYIDEHQILERHVVRNISEFGWTDEFCENHDIAHPYIISIDRDSEQIVGIRRNWREGDETYKKKVWFSHYKFLPGLGPKGFSLLHMVGGLARTATSTLRQLVDAGTFANLPAGFKRRGTRIQGGEELVKPGEFKDVDYFGDRLENAFMKLPYNEPSQVLFHLLGFVVEAGRRYTTTTDPMVGEGDQSGPVGTTVALIEQGQKVFSSIHKRLYRAQKMELNLLAEIIKDTMDNNPYPYDVEGGSRWVLKTDFDERVDVIPVADPNISSSAQRIAQAQAAYQIAQANPNIHDMREVAEKLYTALEISDIDTILPPVDDPKPMDPVTENMAVLHSKPIKAYEDQHHEAHLTVHKQFMMDPRFGQDKQLQQMIGGPMIAHMNEHLAFQYKQTMQQQMRVRIQDTPNFKDRRDMEEYQSQGVQQENLVAFEAARAAPGVLQKGLQEAAQADPEMQKAQLEAQIKQVDLEEAKIDLQRSQVDLQKAIAGAEGAKAKAIADQVTSQADAISAQAESAAKVEESKAKVLETAIDASIEREKIGAGLEEKVIDADTKITVVEMQGDQAVEQEIIKGKNALALQEEKDEAAMDREELKAETTKEVEKERAKVQKAVAKETANAQAKAAAQAPKKT